VAEVANCISVFEGGCDLFVNVWNHVEASTHAWWMHPNASSTTMWQKPGSRFWNQPTRSTAEAKLNSEVDAMPCITDLMLQAGSKLRPTAVSIQQQSPPPRPDNDPWNDSGASLVGVRLTFDGILGAAELLAQHTARTRVAYAAVIRMRLDAGGQHALIRGSVPHWQSIRAAVVGSDVHGAPHLAHDSVSGFTALRGCFGTVQVGSVRTDNCFWSTQPQALVAMVRHVSRHFDRFFLPSKHSQERPCHPRIGRNQEVGMLCAMRELSIASCAVSDSAASCARDALPQLTEEQWSVWPTVRGRPPRVVAHPRGVAGRQSPTL
jgi:hypothetical protein